MSQKKEIKFEQPSFLLLFVNKYISYIIVIIVVVILIGGYLFLFVPKIATIKETRENNTATEVRQIRNKKILDEVVELKISYEKIKEEREDVLIGLKKLMPDGPQTAELFVMMEKIAKDNDFVLNSISVSAMDDDASDKVKTASLNISVTHVVERVEEDEEFPIAIPGENNGELAIDTVIDQNEEEIKTSYESFKQFLTALQRNLRLMEIESFSFGPMPIAEDGGPAGSMSYNFTLTTYFR